MGICQTAVDAVRGLNAGLTSPFGNSLFNIFAALGAADIAIRLGSGGKVGAGDLPALFNTAGIPCFSPELGDTIYITPLQWYANGMSCEGARDPDREALENRIKELQERARLRNQIRERGLDIPPNANFPIDSKKLKEINDAMKKTGAAGGLGGSGSGAEFLAAGILTITWQYTSFSDAGVFFPNPNKAINTYLVNPGDKIKIVSESNIVPGTGMFTGTTFFLQRASGSRETIPGGIQLFVSSPGYYPPNPNPQQFFTGQGAPGTASFEPLQPDPGTSNGSTIIINPLTPPEPPEEGPCDMGCSCGQMQNQQQRQNQNIEKLIREIHKAVGGGLFTSGSYNYQPEQVIENQGKKIYAQNPGRGGTVQVSNLLEGISAAISAHYHRSGLHRFPAKVPDSLIPNSNSAVEAVDIDEITLNDAMAFQEWWFKQWESATGEYPIKYEITDDGKKKEVKLWNQAEVLAEIFGIGLKIQEDSDLGVQWSCRAALEASKSGNAALKNLHLLQEYVKWSGCLTSNGVKDFIKVTSTFSPDPTADPTKAEEMLKPSIQDLQVTNIVDGRSLLGILMNINYWAQISGRANFGDMGGANPLVQSPGQTTNMPGDGIKEIRKKERANNKKWDDWKRTKQQPNTTVPVEQQPPGGLPTPNIIEISRPQNQR